MQFCLSRGETDFLKTFIYIFILKNIYLSFVLEIINHRSFTEKQNWYKNHKEIKRLGKIDISKHTFFNSSVKIHIRWI